MYGRVEGTQNPGECKADADCFKGGCSSEVCSAQSDVITTCEVHEWPQGSDSSCGCVEGQCLWYRVAGGGGDPGGGAAQGMKCDDGKCAEGLSCVSYYGIAGPSGPKFTSCEIPCPLPESTCPDGQTCITIADGPGRVCRPQQD
jgi:eight-cysteine-cluster-containing protein